MRTKSLVAAFHLHRFAHVFSIHLVLALLCMAMPSQASEDDAKALLLALTSSGCESHVSAISRYARSADNERDRNAALKRLSAKTAPPVREQILSVVALMEDGRQGRAKILALTEKVSQFNKLEKQARTRALDQMRQQLWRIIHDPKERIGARMGAPWLLVRIIREGASQHPAWKTDWAQTLEAMLKSSDRSLRVVGAATAAQHRFPEGTDPVKADLVNALLDGLSDESVSVRAAAYLGLRQLVDPVASGMCFDVTDSPDHRAEAMQTWEQWRDANSERLRQERVVQSLF